MTCVECLAKLPDAWDEPDLDTARHLRECAGCRAELRRLRAALTWLETSPAPPTPELRLGIWAGVEAREAVTAEAERLGRRDAWRAGAGGLALLAGGLLYLALAHPTLVPAPPPLLEVVRGLGSWCAELAAGLWASLAESLTGWRLGLTRAEALVPAWITSGWLAAAALGAMATAEWRAAGARRLVAATVSRS